MNESQGNNINNPVGGLLAEALQNIKSYVDMDTLIGEPLSMGEHTAAYPLIKVTVGVVAGGGQYASKYLIKRGKNSYPFAGGTGAGFTAEPVGFLVVNNDQHNLITIQNENAWANTIDKVGDALNQYLKNLAKREGKKE